MTVMRSMQCNGSAETQFCIFDKLVVCVESKPSARSSCPTQVSILRTHIGLLLEYYSCMSTPDWRGQSEGDSDDSCCLCPGGFSVRVSGMVGGGQSGVWPTAYICRWTNDRLVRIVVASIVRMFHMLGASGYQHWPIFAVFSQLLRRE
jgi:hypothetical protein